ncbi:MAG: hypothetical protein ABI268_03725 [Rhodanobacter sp.]
MLGKKNRASVVLIAWHHGHTNKLIGAVGGDERTWQGRQSWPGDDYNWPVLLYFDDHGRLDPVASRVVREHLLPGD